LNFDIRHFLATAMIDHHQTLTIAFALGALAMWLMLPRGTAPGRSVGIVLGIIAIGLGFSQLPRVGQWIGEGMFLVLGIVTVVSAVGAVTFRNPIYCAIWFGQTLLGTAGLFLINGAQFLAVSTVVVYAGAILVTFLFLLMLAQSEGKAQYDRVSWEAPVSAVAGVIIIGILSVAIGGLLSVDAEAPPLRQPTQEALNANILTPEHVARFGGELFGRHLIAIEVAGTLLLAALVGAAVIVAQGKTTNEVNLSPKT
jgi:NADH-quinone oxidoreductase subunit J